MDHGACNVVYLDRRANDEHVRRDTNSASLSKRKSTDGQAPGYFALAKSNAADVRANVETLLTIFHEVHLCGSGSSCISKIADLHRADSDGTPIIVLIDVPYDDEQRTRRLSREPRTPSPSNTRKGPPEIHEPDDIYGMHLLLHVASEIQQKTYSRLVVPVVLLSGIRKDDMSHGLSPSGTSSPPVLMDTVRLVKYLDAGAVDVYTSPLSKSHVHSLAVHAYRVYREVSKEESSFLMTKRNRKLSWVGVEELKPYAYLREAMVSGLMGKICNPETLVETYNSSDIEVTPIRKAYVENAIGTWSFSAHDLSDDELLYASLLMLKHALSMPELERWRMNTEKLTVFLLASRSAYNEFVLYHNFRHVADVLQALFYFLLRTGLLPPYPSKERATYEAMPNVTTTLLKPFDALTLLISAIGHDVGHPGVNNAFLVALNAPLAQLYNDRSVLESFHCAAYSQILRRFWPEAFADIAMRKLMINSILATDMGLHFKYMSDLAGFQEKLIDNKNSLEGWSAQQCDGYKDLLCGLMIKCADICNVARKFDTAARWASILTDEFSNQGTMEQELQMPTCLFGGPPVRDCVIKMGESQIGFMSIFARPLFEAVSAVLPAMRFTVEEILANKAVWEKMISDEREKIKHRSSLLIAEADVKAQSNTNPSPNSRSPEDVAATEDPQCQERADSLPLLDQRGTLSATTGTTGTAASRPSSGQFTGQDSSRRSSLGVVSASEKASHYSSGNGQEPDGHSRRGSGDANVTTIVITQQSDAPTEKDNTARESGCVLPPLRSLSPLKLTSNPKKSENGLGIDDGQVPRPTTAPSSTNHVLGPDEHDMARFPLSNSRQSDYDSPQRPFHHVSSETDLAHMANGSADGSPHSRSPRTRDPDPRKRSDDSGVSPQDESLEARWEQNRMRQNTKGSQRWKSSGWRRDRSNVELAQEKIPNRDEKGGYLSSVTTNASISPTQERSRSGKFGFGKIWKKLKSNGEQRPTELEPEARSPKQEV